MWGGGGGWVCVDESVLHVHPIVVSRSKRPLISWLVVGIDENLCL